MSEHSDTDSIISKSSIAVVGSKFKRSDIALNMLDGPTSSSPIPDTHRQVQSFVSDPSFWRGVAAEFIATALFIYVVCGAVLASVKANGATGPFENLVGIALAAGLSISALIFCTAHHSGGHINPIVTLAFVFPLETIHWFRGLLYILAQICGASIGALLLNLSADGNNAIAATVTHASGSLAGAFLMEMILSFLLMHVIIETAVNAKSKVNVGANAPIAIGIAVFMAHIVAIPFTGASINPARSFGAALVSLDFRDLWIYLTAPFVGATLASLLAIFGFRSNK